MLCIDYYPSLFHRSLTPAPYATNPGNVAPLLLIQGLVLGIAEETVFRGAFGAATEQFGWLMGQF